MLSFLNPLPTLPDYPGPHKVGTVEYEIPVSEIPSKSAVPDPTISTVKFRIFYPTVNDAKTTSALYWLPTPQDRWNEAYASFLGASPRLTAIIKSLPSFLNFVKLPALGNAPLLPHPNKEVYPLAIFSHGLGGNYNTYSSITGGLASCGVVCVAPEHRDGSAPVSFLKNASGDIEKTIEYQKLSHSPTSDVLNARNAQLRIRSWELELIYTAVHAMNEGKTFTNYADSLDNNNSKFSGSLNLASGKVAWVGHSFGAATMTQFVKSIYHRQHLPTPPQQNSIEGWDWTPLYVAADDDPVSKQIIRETPVALLDLWTLPLRGEVTKWLWERPLPCYDRDSSLNTKTSTVAVMSAEFYKWTELLNRTRAALSKDPIRAAEAPQTTQEADILAQGKEETVRSPPIPELVKRDFPLENNSQSSSRSATPSNDSGSSHLPSPRSSQSSLSLLDSTEAAHVKSGAVEPHLYLVPQSAHLSQSDFGPLFPTLTRYAMKAIEPETTIKLNLRAILAVIQNVGLSTESLVDDDQILSGKGLGEGARWVRIPLIEC